MILRYENIFCTKENNNNFIQQFLSSMSHYSTILESMTYENNVCNVFTRIPYLIQIKA